MSKVNLFIIGVNKAGTSWLYYLLDHHPDVFMADPKELYFFGEEGRGPQDLEAYHAHFPFEDTYRYFGEATVMYYRSEDVADEMKAYNPEAKLLAIVRDPIDRLLSQFQYHKQLGLIDENTSPSEALTDRESRLLRDSHYEETLPAFADRFGPDQFKIFSLEAGQESPEAFWDELLTYLDLPHVSRPTATNRPENPTGSAAFRWVYRSTVRPLRKHLPGVFRWMLRSQMIRWIKLGLLRLLGTADKKTVPPDVYEQLREEFAPTYAFLQRQGFGKVYNEQ